MNVLLIEHEHLTRAILKDELSRFSFVTGVANVATETAAEEMLRFTTPDAVFLDMQLPESGAFRIAGRIWNYGIPAIICTTAFDRPLLAALRRHRVEHLVRPFSSEELAYILTHPRRPNPTSPAENLRRLLDAAVSLNHSVSCRLSVFRNGENAVIDVDEIVALRNRRGRVSFWTSRGIFETGRPLDELWAYAGFSTFRRVYGNAFLRIGSGRSPGEFRRARLWLQRCALADFVLNRAAPPASCGISSRT